MKRHYKSKEDRKLIPGQFYNFQVLKLISIPGDNDFFVLVDLSGNKHLLRASYYMHYPIHIKEYYRCRVDKINCQGRIFLEPVHPMFNIGEIHIFEVREFIGLNSKKGVKEYFKMLAPNGEFGLLPAKSSNQFKFGDKLPCRIYEIKKAQIFLQIP